MYFSILLDLTIVKRDKYPKDDYLTLKWMWRIITSKMTKQRKRLHMDSKQLPFHYEDRQVVEELLVNVGQMIKDSDAVAEKEAVRMFLQQVSEAISFVVIGSGQVGKSSLLNALFQFSLFDQEELEDTKGFCEYRGGASKTVTQPDDITTRVFVPGDNLSGLQAVDMPGIDQISRKDLVERVREYIQRSSVLLAVYDARKVTDYTVWDFLEGVTARKVVFVLTKCDLAEPETIEQSEMRLRQYMAEAKLEAPIFKVSVSSGQMDSVEESGMEELRSYIAGHVIGENPVLRKQQENLTKLKAMLNELSLSFENRVKQYDQDAAIMRDISKSLDSFIANNQEHVEMLKESLKREIENEIQNYQTEIIAKLDPHKIKERFPNGSVDFVDYLNLMNESYRKRMTDNVNRMTQESVQAYLAKLEKIFDETTGYLRTRKSLIQLEDKFYGSMMESKKGMVQRAAHSAESTKDYYHTLADASTELFMKLWRARESRDRVVTNVTVAGGVTGAAAGVGAGLLINALTAGAAEATAGATAATAGVTAAGAAGTAAGATAGSLVFWPVVGFIVGTLLIAVIARKIAQANTLPEMEKRVAEAIAEFKEEVARIKEEMTGQILDTVDRMFQREVEVADKSFAEFRMSVNIDSRNIPLLEEKLQLIHSYMDQLEIMRQRSVIEP